MSEQGAPPWTEHNSSDPGITILDVLAYSLTALGLAATTVAVVRQRRKGRGRSGRRCRTGLTGSPSA